MKRKLFFVTFNLLVVLAFVKLLPAQLKVDIRFALFTKIADDLSYFDSPYDEINKEKPIFRSYKEKYVRQVLENHKIEPIAFDDSISYALRAKAISLSFSQNGGEGCGQFSDDLIKNIKWLTEKHGCCSDHSQVFIALCLSNNIFAREVHHNSHTFNEFYDKKLQKWIWIDSQYCLMAKDSSSNNYLSLHEIYNSIKENKAIFWDFFGKEIHRLYGQKDYAKAISYYNSDEFNFISMTLGNNVFEVDHYNRKLNFLPQEVKQLILLTLGIQPSYLVYDPLNRKIPYWQALKIGFWISTLLFAAINFWILLPSLKYRIKRRFFIPK